MPQCRDIDQVGVLGMDAHFSDVSRASKAQVFPGFTCIGRFVDAIAMGDVAANGCFAHADIDDVGIGGGDCNRADRCTLKEAIRNVFPGDTAIGCFPDATTRGAKIKYLRMLRVTSDGDDAATAERAYQAPFKRIQ